MLLEKIYLMLYASDEQFVGRMRPQRAIFGPRGK
jgi:hypothetical protein